MNFTDKERKTFLTILQEHENKGQQIKEIKSLIDEELKKPDEEMDRALIDECIQFLAEIKDSHEEEISDVRMGENISRINQSLGLKRRKRFMENRLVKASSIVVILIVVFVFANFMVAKATGQNVFDGIVEFGQNFIGLDFNKQASSSPIVENDQLYQSIKAECTKYDLSPLIPKSYPKDMKLINLKENNTTQSKVLTITVGENKNSVVIFIAYYLDKQNIPEFKMPDSTKLDQLNANGNAIYLSKEADKYTAVFNDGNYLYNISSSLKNEQMLELLKSLN
jgi:DNA-binding transcriptional MerR regulator